MGKNPLQESMGQYQVEAFFNGETTSKNFKSATKALKFVGLALAKARFLLDDNPNSDIEIMFHSSAPMEEKEDDKKTVNKAV